MNLPGVKTTIADFGLGIGQTEGSRARAIVGPCTKGVPGAYYAIRNLEDITSTIGVGPLADSVSLALAAAGGVVYAVPTTTTAGVGAVVPGSANPALPVVSLVGTPDQSMSVHVRITEAGTEADAEFRYSIDGGDTWSRSYAVGSVPSVPVGVSSLNFSFPAGAYVENAVYTFSVTAPESTVAEMEAAIRGFLEYGIQVEYIEVPQPTGVGFWAALDSIAKEFEEEHNAYIYFIANAPIPSTGQTTEAWVSALVAEKGDWSSEHGRVVVCAGSVETVLPLSGTVVAMGVSSHLGARVGAILPHTDPGQYTLGAIPRALYMHPTKVVAGGVLSGYKKTHAEVLRQAGFCVMMTHENSSGLYFASARSAAVDGSDYMFLPNRRVMNAAARRVSDRARQYVLEGISLSQVAIELDAFKLHLDTPLRNMAAEGMFSGYEIRVPTPQDIIQTRTLNAEILIQPLGYAEFIRISMSLAQSLGGSQ